MNKDTLKMFLAVVLEFFKPKVPAWAYALIKSVLDKLVTDFVPVMGAAPDQLKDWVKAHLLEYVNKIPVPFVAAVLTRILTVLDGQLLDYLWDLAQARLLGRPPVMMAAPEVALTFEDLVDSAAA